MFKTHKTLKIIGLILLLLLLLFALMTINRNSSAAADQAAISPANMAPTAYQNRLPLTWVAVDWEKVNQTPEMDFPKIAQNGNVYAARDLIYASRGSTNLTLDLYSNTPPAPGDLKPMVVYIHGGGMIGGTKNQLDGQVSDVMLGLINKGFIVASINYEEAPAAQFPAQIQDVVMALRYLRYYAYGIGGNQNKIGAFGDSVGGQLAALVGVTNGLAAWENSPQMTLAGANLSSAEIQKIPSRPNAVVDYYGGTELPPKVLIEAMKLLHIGSYHDPLANKTYAMADLYQMIYNTDSTLLHEGSAINYVTGGEPPILIVQGDKDTLTPPNTSTDFYNTLKAAGNDATLIAVKNAEHRFLPSPAGATIDPSFESIIKTTVNFLAEKLR